MIPGYVWNVPATVERIIDGDTFRATLDLGWRIAHRVVVRLQGIYAPELGTPDGDVARAFVEQLMPPGTVITVQSRRLDKYGRTEGDAILPDGRSLITVLLAAGHARPA